MVIFLKTKKVFYIFILTLIKIKNIDLRRIIKLII